MNSALSITRASLTARLRRGLGAMLAVLATLGTLSLASAQPAAAVYDRIDKATSFESSNFPGRYMRHRYYLGELLPTTNNWDRNDATFIVRRGLDGNPNSVSFESANFRGQYLRHQGYRIKMAAPDGTDFFKWDASFLPRASRYSSQWRFESVNFPGQFIRHQNFELWLARDDGSVWFHNDSSWRGLPVAPHCANADTSITASTIAAVEGAITCLTNQERVARGLAPLAVNATLTGTARAHSQDMVRRKYYHHNTPEGVDPCQRLLNAGYRYTACGENIHSLPSPATANRLMSDWMMSPPHRGNILSEKYAFTEIGVGVAAGTWWGGIGSAGGTATQNFGRR